MLWEREVLCLWLNSLGQHVLILNLLVQSCLLGLQLLFVLSLLHRSFVLTHAVVLKHRLLLLLSQSIQFCFNEGRMRLLDPWNRNSLCMELGLWRGKGSWLVLLLVELSKIIKHFIRHTRYSWLVTSWLRGYSLAYTWLIELSFDSGRSWKSNLWVLLTLKFIFLLNRFSRRWQQFLIRMNAIWRANVACLVYNHHCSRLLFYVMLFFIYILSQLNGQWIRVVWLIFIVWCVKAVKRLLLRVLILLLHQLEWGFIRILTAVVLNLALLTIEFGNFKNFLDVFFRNLFTSILYFRSFLLS